MIRRGLPLLLAALLPACGSEDRRDQGREQASPPAAPAAPADSLVLETPAASVWHTLSRTGISASGDTCLERTIEIRGADSAPPIRVPLLYTRDVPTIIDDSTLEARVYRDCIPGTRYRIDMRTGQPTPVR